MLVFDVPMRGNPLLAVASSCVFLTGALFWGLLISAAARSQLLAYQASLLTSFLPAFLLSGFVYAIENMPAPIRLITYLVPARYLIVILKGVFLKGSDFGQLWPQMLALAIFGAAILGSSALRFRKRLD